MNTTIDLKKEHQKTLETPRYKYSLMAKLFFWGMNIIAGKNDNLPKAKLIEILASIPYRTWEIKHYLKLTFNYKNINKTNNFSKIIEWGRDAQDNEFIHLLVIQEKMKEDNIKDKWYLNSLFVIIVVFSYIIITKIMAFFSQKRAFLFNAEFENHAEMVYAKMVNNNPQWETEKVNNDIVKKYADIEYWADVFRRISLDERDHMNNSFKFCNKPEFIITYQGMPDLY